MVVTVACLGPARREAGAETVAVDLPEGSTVSDLLAALDARGGGLTALLPTCAVAVGDRIVGPEETIEAALAHDVALLPPVAGG